jgi:D-threonate/D-erythronate kinase
MRCVIVADDLTGAADSSAALAERGATVAVLPWSDDGGATLGTALSSSDCDVLVVESDSRDLDDVAASARLALVARTLHERSVHGRGAPLVIKKVDSVLRGPIAAELAALRTVLQPARTVLAPAFPRLGRTTEDGVQLRDGLPVGSAPDEAHLPPARRARHADVARACGIDDAVRVSAGAPLPDAAVTVHDARADADLVALARTIVALDPQPLVVCSAGLLEALAPHLAPHVAPHLAPHGRDGAARGPGGGDADADVDVAREAGAEDWSLIVSLSPTAAACAQVDDLVRSSDVARVPLSIADAVDDPALAGEALAARIGAALARGEHRVLVTLDDTGIAASDDETSARARLAVLGACRRAFAALPRPARIVANGGDAARTTVDAWRLGRLDVVGPRPHGAAEVRSGSTSLVLKSGGFGPAHALTDLVHAMLVPAIASGGIAP